MARQFQIPGAYLDETASRQYQTVDAFLNETSSASSPGNASPSVVEATFSVIAPAVTGAASTAPAVLDVTASVQAPTVTGAASTGPTFPGYIGVIATLPAPAVTGEAIASPSVGEANFSAPAPTVTGAATASADVLAATFTVNDAMASGAPTAFPETLDATFEVNPPIVTGSALASPAVLSATFTILTPEVTGDEDVEPIDCGTNVLANGEAWLSSMLQAHASVPIVYRRGSDQVVLCATMDRTLLRLTDEMGGVRVEWTDRDFIIPAGQLILGGDLTLPERDDEIRQVVDGKRHTFRVWPYGPDEPQWTWHGTHRKMLRIRTKRITTEPV